MDLLGNKMQLMPLREVRAYERRLKHQIDRLAEMQEKLRSEVAACRQIIEKRQRPSRKRDLAELQRQPEFQAAMKGLVGRLENGIRACRAKPIDGRRWLDFVVDTKGFFTAEQVVSSSVVMTTLDALAAKHGVEIGVYSTRRCSDRRKYGLRCAAAVRVDLTPGQIPSLNERLTTLSHTFIEVRNRERQLAG